MLSLTIAVGLSCMAVGDITVRFEAPPGWNPSAEQRIALWVRQTTDWSIGGRPLVTISCEGGGLALQPIQQSGTLLEFTFDGTSVADPSNILCTTIMQNTVQGAVEYGAIAWSTETTVESQYDLDAPGSAYDVVSQ